MTALFHNPVFIIISLIRLVIPFLIFKKTKVSIILSLIVDDIDGDFLETYANITREDYQIYDKLMDSWWLIFIFIYILLNNIPHKKLFITLFVYRIIGVIIMTFWFREWLLILFPNIFEPLIELFVFFPALFNLSLFGLRTPYSILLITILFVILRECWLHVLKMDTFDMKGFAENNYRDYWRFWFRK